MTMDAERWERVQEILADALELGPGERDVFVAQACADDPTMREEVESLLQAAASADGYFDDLAGRAGITHDPDTDPGSAEAATMEGRRIGAYRLGPLLGRGGMGAVYVARRDDGHFDLTAALKILPTGATTAGSHARFLEERRILARLEHPNIARLLDGGVSDEGTPYFVMELVRGTPITEYCRDRRLGLRARLALFLEVCDAVAYAHQKLVVHRDLKPSNVFVTEGGDVKLLDFGIASLVEGEGEEASSPRTARPMTPRYASPELLIGAPVTTSSDVYQLGVILHEILTGLSPYDLSQTGTTLVEAICQRPVDAPSTRLERSGGDGNQGAASGERAAQALGRRLRGDLDSILLQTLRKEPEGRYPSAEAMAEDIRRHLDGYPVRARPATPGYVAGRFLKRHTVAATATAAVAVLLVALVVVSIRFAVTTSEQAVHLAMERDKAEQVSAFVWNLFEVANPALAGGDTVTARALLDRGADKVREDLGDDPEMAAEMLTVLGTAYHSLGLPEPALELLREARTIQDEAGDVPPDHVAETKLRLGLALRDAGQPVEGSRILREARDELEAIQGAAHRSVALATFELATALHASGDPSSAEPEFRRAVETFRTLDLEPDEDYARALYLLAEFLQVRGETEDVEALYRESLEVIESLHGRIHPNVPPILVGLTWVAVREGDPATGTELLREGLEIDRQLYAGVEGGNHPSLAMSHLYLGRHLARHGDPDEAEELLTESVRIFDVSSQPRPAMHGTAVLALATLVRDRGRPAEALDRFREAAAIFRDAFGEGSLMEAGAQVDLADLLVAEGRAGEAGDPLEAALRAYEGVLPADHRRVQQARALLERVRGG